MEIKGFKSSLPSLYSAEANWSLYDPEVYSLLMDFESRLILIHENVWMLYNLAKFCVNLRLSVLILSRICSPDQNPTPH